jgi:hypothetical protein
MTIKLEELTMGRDKLYPNEYTQEVKDNLLKLLEPMQKIRAAYNKPMRITSGWRPAAVNANVTGSAKKSNHMKGLACDVQDRDGSLWKWCMENLQALKDLGIYLEDKRWTPTWVHFQIVAPGSKNRIFKPFAGDPPHPNLWDGKYDSKFN